MHWQNDSIKSVNDKSTFCLLSEYFFFTEPRNVVSGFESATTSQPSSVVPVSLVLHWISFSFLCLFFIEVGIIAWLLEYVLCVWMPDSGEQVLKFELLIHIRFQNFCYVHYRPIKKQKAVIHTQYLSMMNNKK